MTVLPTLLVQRRPIVGELFALQPVLPDLEAPAYYGRCLSYRDMAPGYGQARLRIGRGAPVRRLAATPATRSR